MIEEISMTEVIYQRSIKNNYVPVLNIIETELAIKYVKDNFEKNLASSLKIFRVSAPLFVLPKTGLNDNLSGWEKPVSFKVKELTESLEIIQSLAKWKRNALKLYDFKVGTGLYTDMNAIRPDEDLDYCHSLYVDQWDWEKIIDVKNRSISYLIETVEKIYQALLKTSKQVVKKFPKLTHKLPSNIFFISSTELINLYPNHTSKEREYLITKEYKAVFIYQIGWPLKDGKPHDQRAADYDDWNLNGDIIIWYDLLQTPIELSSMGIRVNAESLKAQLENRNLKGETPYHIDVLSDRLPLTIGGGIGQSRMCMILLDKAHIGEVQVSTWPNKELEIIKKYYINLL